MVLKIPPKERWQQNWTEKEAATIKDLAEKLRFESPGPINDASLWMTAEGDYSQGIFVKEI